MLSRNAVQVEFFGIDFNFATNSFFSSGQGSVSPFPPISGNFLLMDGTDFLLLDGTNFLLLT